MARHSLLSLGLCFLVILHGCAAFDLKSPRYKQRRYQQDECMVERLTAQEPSRQIRSEAGTTEIWDENDNQFRCAGVVALRHTIEGRGLLVPSYTSGPKLYYVVQGRGFQGTAYSGCPETFQTSEGEQPQLTRERRQTFRGKGEYQKIRHIREGDIVAVPLGVVDYYYNDGDSPLVLVAIIDTSNFANQLDENHRKFFLSGSPKPELQGQRQYQQSQGTGQQGQQTRLRKGEQGNMLDGFDEQILADSFNVDQKLVRQMRSDRDNRGIIIRVQDRTQILTSLEKQVTEEHEDNDLTFRDIDFCQAKLKLNINDPLRADFYNPRAGRLTIADSLNLPILRILRLSAEKVTLYRDALYAPHWNTNAHSICYITRGNGRIQIVSDNGRTVFDGQVQEGQIITAPQNFVVVKQAGSEGLEWVAFKTHDQAKRSHLSGRDSALRGLPEEVIANAFGISKEEARRVKYSRVEVAVLSPGSRSEYGHGRQV